MTTLTTAANDATQQDTTGGGNDCRATAQAQFGLAAYLRERVHPGGILAAAAGRMAPTNAQTLTAAILNRVYNGLDITLAEINTLLITPAAGGTVGTDLDGAAGFSKSFGAVEDILQILYGEVYEAPRYVIITNIAAEFLSLAERDILVAAQDTATTGKTFVSSGHFLADSEHGYVNLPLIAQTGELLISVASGDLYAYMTSKTFLNPSFAYDAAGLALGKPPAVRWDGVAVPATGVAKVCYAYDYLGAAL
jgi:hypothetical protein